MAKMKKAENLKLILRQLGFGTLFGLAFGIPLGYVATDYLELPIGYVSAIGICLGCAYGIQIFQTITEVCLYPRFRRLSRGKNLAFQVLSSALAHFFGWLLAVWIASLVIGFELLRGAIFIWLGSFIVGVLIIHLTHQLVNFYRELREKDVLEEKLKTLAAQAELKALRAQINPHFLFNSLNTIASLVNSDPSKAEESVERLADIFRYALSASDKEFVTLRDELEFIDSYLEIEKARFGERLEVTKDISPNILDTPIPSLILQPLVENSIKHGSGENGKMRISINGRMDSELIQLAIKDEGKGVPEHIINGVYTNGTGLRNVSERLHRVYSEEYGLEIKENTPSGTIAIVTIPREKK
jgi:sensor histidine kinase YesM